VQFLELTPFEHRPLYRAAIEPMAAVDPFAGLLCSMHGAGLDGARFGTFSLAKLNLNDAERALVVEFLADTAALHVPLARRSGIVCRSGTVTSRAQTAPLPTVPTGPPARPSRRSHPLRSARWRAPPCQIVGAICPARHVASRIVATMDGLRAEGRQLRRVQIGLVHVTDEDRT
jgi:hypothetical protein